MRRLDSASTPVTKSRIWKMGRGPSSWSLVESRVVFGAAFRVREDGVGLLHAQELLEIAGLRIVGMEARRHDAEDAVDGLDVGLGADLERLVVIGSVVAGRCLGAGGGARKLVPELEAEPEDSRRGARNARPRIRR